MVPLIHLSECVTIILVQINRHKYIMVEGTGQRKIKKVQKMTLQIGKGYEKLIIKNNCIGGNI